MIPNRLLALFGLIFAFMGTTAHAGDISQFQIIGFSPDAKVFAFEQYGVQDGSGFAYSDIYFIDTVKDTYLPNTPIKVQTKDETLPLGNARAKAHDKAAALIAQYKLKDHPGILAAYNPFSEANDNPDKLDYWAVQTDPRFGEKMHLALEKFPKPTPAKCKDMTDGFAGFRLTLMGEQDPEAKTVYEDSHVPASRGCVMDYRLGAVATTGTADGPQIAFVSVVTFGFEGNDHRWIAIPIHPAH